ncbi:XisI protein [Calothrix sp. 336/3]|uniref:XisI protein n=1 Tax=Calothrix sp. 336/3 TaxID=1337936 RepID=UPI0004E2D777|nr:XisI protein [Calothrix sp. 336/3]AKG20332.1 fatty-acid oxidation protein subunit alpha [Calothrix sp. 336/3]
MDTLNHYRQIISELIYEYAKYKPSHGQIEAEAIVNPATDHYELMHVCWDGQRRVHGCVLHIDIIQGKIWIQHDGTNRPVAEELLEAGVPKEDIILGFHPPQVRQYTDFGVA